MQGLDNCLISVPRSENERCTRKTLKNCIIQDFKRNLIEMKRMDHFHKKSQNCLKFRKVSFWNFLKKEKSEKKEYYNIIKTRIVSDSIHL